MGNIFYQQSNYDSALSFYRRAYEANPDYYIAAVNLANTYIDVKIMQRRRSLHRLPQNWILPA